MNEDLEPLEALCRDIVRFRAGSSTREQLWDCLERLGQEILVLRLQHEQIVLLASLLVGQRAKDI